MDILKRFEQKGYKLVAMKVALTAALLPPYLQLYSFLGSA